VYNEMMRRLMKYQRCSVEFICDHFKEHSKCILADEVGLGKTEVAKGVIASMVKAHAESGTSEPFRVAYICPNQNVASQNFPKLQLYHSKKTRFELDKDTVERLKLNLDIYHNYYDKLRDRNSWKELDLRKPNANQIKSIQRSSVYTRIWDWLIALAEGKDIEQVLEDTNLYETYRGEYPSSREWSQNQNDVTQNTTSIAIKLFNEQISVLDRDTKDGKHLSDMLTALAVEKKGLQWLNRIYRINRAFINMLVDTDDSMNYRLSMLHLLQKKDNRLMQLDALTPKTSVDIDNRKGTIVERACIAATYDYIFGSNKLREATEDKG